MPALHALAPTQTESVFAVTPLTVLVLTAALTLAAAIRFRRESV